MAKQPKNKVVAKITFVHLVLSASFPILLAAFRDDTVGTDLRTYGIIYWDNACYSSSFFEYLISLSVLGGTEIGYSLLNWSVSCFTKDIHWLFFVHQSIIILFLYAAIWKFRDNKSSVLVLLFYYLYGYNLSLSLLRQFISITIILYASTFLFERGKKKWFYIWIVVATLFHNSSVFAIFIPIIKYVSLRFSNKMLLVYAIAAIGSLGLMIFYQTVMGWFISHGLLSAKYEMYLDQEGFRSHKINLLVECVIIAVNYLLIYRYRNIKYFNFVQFLSVICLLLELMGGIVETACRVVMYLIFIISLYVYKSSNDREVSHKALLLYCFAAMVMFLYVSSQEGLINGETIPYTSKILGIE